MLPTQDAILSLMRLCENVGEAAEYLAERFEATLKANKVDKEFRDLIQEVYGYSSRVTEQMTMARNIWAGKAVPNLAENRELAHLNIPSVKADENAKPVQLQININENSQMDRYYDSNVEPGKSELIDEDKKQLDQLLLAWIARENIFRQDKIMYQADATGAIKTDAKGQPLRISPEALEKKFMDPIHGFAAYAAQQTKAFQINLEVNQVPSEKLGIEPMGAAGA